MEGLETERGGLLEGNPMTLSFPIDPFVLLINNGNHSTGESK